MFPTPFTVGLRVWSEGPPDSRGDATDVWAAPVERKVYYIGPAGTSEPFEVGRDAVTWDLDLGVPPAWSSSPKDRVVVDGEEYTIEGRVQDFNKGPFGFRPGGVVRLRRVTG